MAYEIPYDSNYGEWYGVPQNVARLSADLEQTTDEDGYPIGLITASWDMPDNGGTFVAQLSTNGAEYYVAESNITQNSVVLTVDADTDYYLKIITVLGGNQSSGTVSNLLSTDIPTPNAPIVTVTPSGLRINVGIIPIGYTASIRIDDGTNTNYIETSEIENMYLCDAGVYEISVAFMDVNGNVGTSSASVSVTVSELATQTYVENYVEDYVEENVNIYNLKTPLMTGYIVTDDGGDYYTDTAGEVILKHPSVTYKKYNNLPAIAGIVHRSLYRSPLLVSTIEDAVKIQLNNTTPTSSQGSFEMNGIVWYYCANTSSNYDWDRTPDEENFPIINNGTRYDNVLNAAKKLVEEADPTLFVTESVEENLFYPTDYTLSSGDTITDETLKSMIAYHRPISINGTVYTPSDYTNGTYTYYALKNGTSSAEIGKVQIDSSWAITITTESGGGGGYVLPIASSSTLGGVKVGNNLSIDGNGVMSATDTTYTDFVGSGASASSGLVPAPPTIAGTTKYLREDGSWSVPQGGGGGSYTAGDGIDITNDTISLETASTTDIGGVIVGSGLSIDANGVLSAIGGGGGGSSYSETELFSSSSGVSSGTIPLSDSIRNYNMLEIDVGGTSSQNINSAIYTVNYVLASNNSAGNTRIITSRYNTSYVTWAYDTDASFVINEVGGNGKIFKVVGIKF